MMDDDYVFFIGVNYAIKFARECRRNGIRLHRIRKGHWKIQNPLLDIYLPNPNAGMDLYLSAFIKGEKILQIDRPVIDWKVEFDWGLKFHEGPIHSGIVWHLSYRWPSSPYTLPPNA